MGSASGEIAERLLPCVAPRAVLALVETQAPLPGLGVTVERYSTAHRVIFEKHIYPSGAIHWFKVLRGAKPRAGYEISVTNGAEQK